MTGCRSGLAALAVLVAVAGCDVQPAPSPADTTLRVVMGTDISSVDPHVPFDDISSLVILNVYDRLVRLDAALQVEPDLARRWINPDERTWRFFLDPNARFSDGTALHAEDVVASIERARRPGEQVSAFVRAIDRVEAVDEHTVDVHTRRPVAVLNDLVFLPIASARSLERARTEGASAIVGTGPFRVTSREPGRRTVLDAQPFHRHRSRLRRVVLEVVPGAPLVDEVRRQPPDLALYLRIDAQQALDRAPPPGTRLVAAPGLFVVYLAFNIRPSLPDGTPNALADVRVRRALGLAVDRDALARDTMGRFARPASQLVGPAVFGFDPATPQSVADVEAARLLLEESGNAGLEVPVDVSTLGSHRIESALVSQWAAAGIAARLRVHDDGELPDFVEHGRFATTVQGWGCTGGDAGEILSFLLHSRDEPRGRGLSNVTGLSEPDLDRLVEESSALAEPRLRRAALQQALRVAGERLAYVPLLSRDDVALVSDRIEWTPRVDGEVRLDEIAIRP